MYGDNLPFCDDDPVLVLYAHYFLAADLMRENYFKLERKRKRRGRLGRKGNVKQGVYISSWLGFLAVTCEGFKKLKMHLLLNNDRPNDFKELVARSGEIYRKVNLNADEIRRFRNSVFHLRSDVCAITKFLERGQDRLAWADELHASFDEFFSEYRVLCAVHNVLHNRMSEGGFWR